MIRKKSFKIRFHKHKQTTTHNTNPQHNKTQTQPQQPTNTQQHTTHPLQQNNKSPENTRNPIEELDIDAMKANLSAGALAEKASPEDIELARAGIEEVLPKFYKQLSCLGNVTCNSI